VILVLAAVLADWKPPPCNDPKPGGDAHCAQRDFARADAAMKTQFERALYALRTCRPANSVKCSDMPRAIMLLHKEQQAWTAWRDAKCDVTTFGVEHTSAEAQVRLDCRTGMTIERTKELREIVKR
jgi:uncharacterized protein YecT (DUF1311 family)